MELITKLSGLQKPTEDRSAVYFAKQFDKLLRSELDEVNRRSITIPICEAN